MRSPLSRIQVTGILFGAVLLVPTGAESSDSISLHLDRIRGLVGKIGRELDSLEQAVSSHQEAKPFPAVNQAEMSQESSKPILGELLSEKEKKLAAAATTPFQRCAIGYSFDPNLSIGMHYLQWKGQWGIKAAASGRFNESNRQVGVDLAFLRGLHRFSLFEGLQTHLYAFAGAGAFWHRVPYNLYFGGFSPGAPPNLRSWYETADIPIRLQLGAGTELGLLAIGGVRAAPEIGFQAAHHITRFQDSKSWETQSRMFPGYQERPKSDFSLDAYFAFHLSFYFR